MAGQINVRRNMAYLIGGYSYALYRTYNNVRYLRCSERYRQCLGRGKLHPTQEFEVIGPHVHPPNLHLEEDVMFINTLFDACRSQFRSPRVIYDDIARRFPQSVQSVPFSGIYNDLHRWQREGLAFLPNPTSVIQFIGFINSVRYLTRREHDSGTLWVRSTFHDEEATTSAVFGDIDFINSLGVIDNLHIVRDGSKVPHDNGACEVMTVTVNANNYAFPCLWVVLPNRYRRTYDMIMNEILTFFRINDSPRVIFADFDRKVHGSLSTYFPRSIIQTTFHSYCVALLIEAEMQGLIPFDNGVKIVFRQLIALSFLPAEGIPIAFGEIQNSASPVVRAILINFFGYYENNWINGVTPALFSFYEKIEALTDCGVTNLISLTQSLGNNVNIWSFNHQIQKITHQTCKDLERLRLQQRVNVTPRVRSVIGRNQVERAWNLFARGKITSHRLLELTTVFVTEYLETLIHRNAWMGVELEELVIGVEEDVEFQDFEYLLDSDHEEAAENGDNE